MSVKSGLIKNEGNELRQNSIKIPEEVFVSLCANAVLSTQGIADLSGGITESISRNFLGKASPHRGIKIAVNEQEVITDVFVTVRYGVKIPEVAWSIQENVKRAVEEETGYTVKAVNIHVQGVAFVKKERNEKIRTT